MPSNLKGLQKSAFTLANRLSRLLTTHRYATCILLFGVVFMLQKSLRSPREGRFVPATGETSNAVPEFQEPIFVADAKNSPKTPSTLRIAVLNTIFVERLSNMILEGLYTWSANAELLDYFLFTNGNGAIYRDQLKARIPHAKNIHIIDKYPGYDSDAFAFIRERMTQLLKEINMDPLPEFDYDLGGKFCDIRPFFGDLFADWIRAYSHWAWTDQHVYAGDLKPYLQEWLGAYDVITFAPPTGGGWRMYTTGRLSIFRNDKPYIKSYWKLTDTKTIYDKYHKNPNGVVADEWWFSMPIFKQKNITFMQSYVQSDDAHTTVWYRRCNEEKKCTNHYLWKYKIQEYWYQDMLKMKGPEGLDSKWDINNYLQPWGDKKNIDMEKIAGYYNFYRVDGQWFRTPMDSSIIVNYDPETKRIVLEPKIVHARNALCQIQESDREDFILNDERNCLPNKSD